MSDIYKKLAMPCPQCGERLSLDYEPVSNEYFLCCTLCGWDEVSEEKDETESTPVYIAEPGSEDQLQNN